MAKKLPKSKAPEVDLSLLGIDDMPHTVAGRPSFVSWLDQQVGGEWKSKKE